MMLTKLPPIDVQGKFHEPGGLLLRGMVGENKRLLPDELKPLLFARHEASFFGTKIELARIDKVENVLLPAEYAIPYLACPQPNSLASLQWSEPLHILGRIARLYRDALAEGQFAPSYAKMKEGQPGWTLLLSDELQHQFNQLLEEAAAGGFPRAEQWFDRCLDEWIRRDPALSQAWDAVTATHTELTAAPPTESPQDAWLDEDDWLVAIGWRTDNVPFVVCVQLCEPDDERGWTLRMPLQDRNDASILVDVDGDTGVNSGTAGGGAAIPGQWLPEASRQRAKAIRKLLLAAPELRAGELADAGAGAESRAGASAGVRGEAKAGAQAGAWDEAKAGAQAGAWDEAKAGADVRQDETSGVSGATRPGSVIRALSDEQALMFLERTSVELARAGLRVLLPAWWDEVRRLKPKLRAKLKSSVGSPAQSLLGLDQLVQFDWRVAVGDLDLSEEEFRRLTERQQRLARIRGRWMVLDPALLAQIQKKMKQVGSNQTLSFRDVLGLHFAGARDENEAPDEGADEGADGQAAAAAMPRLQLEVELNEHLLRLVTQLQQTAAIPSLTPPDGLHGTLRKYQADGAAWLAFLRQFGLGGCLADDMGLGKTVQFISYLLHARETAPGQAPALLIAPTSVLGNWQKELERFAPALRVHLHYGTQREKGDDFSAALANGGGADLVVTSYALAHLDEEELRSLRWSCICLDEAQNIKNAYTKQAAAIRRLDADHRIALTGTPIENRLTELWSIFDFINPGYLGSLSSFTRHYVTPIEKTKDPALIGQVQRLVRPFLMRRLKKDPAIRLDLPDKNEAKAYVSLTAEQGALYEQVVQETMSRIETLGGMERRGLILATLTKLKQICNHPALYAKEPAAASPDSAANVARSDKIARLLDMVREAREEGDRCLIFTQYVEMGHMLVDIVSRELDEPAFFLHGGVPKTKRDRLVAAFQNPDERCGIFILSLKAGGTGLNLTAANHVFHVDRWWNPAVEEQATDRAFRIGQTRDVQVHKFVTLGTLEERIDDMLERKHGLSKQIVESGEGWITELSTGELKDLFALRREWIDK